MKINNDYYLLYLYRVSSFLNLHIIYFYYYNLFHSDYISFKSIQYLMIHVIYNIVNIIDSIIQIREIHINVSNDLYLKNSNTSIECNIIYHLFLILYDQSFSFIFYMYLLLNARVISDDKILWDVFDTIQHFWW